MSQETKDRNDLEISKLEKLTDEQLRDKILEINSSQLSRIGDMSYYYLAGESGKLIQLVNDGFLNQIKSPEEKEILVKSFDTIIKSFRKFHINMTKEERDKKVEQLLDTRKKLCNLSNAICEYKIEILYIKELLDYYTMKIVGRGI